ncbi:MAG TPA: helix-turn-helix transcriptional regulator [Chloroflexota bacterium]|nr:helix-turn-helix transcriptional regulator [Chloroflexota bacterium]
MTGGPRASARPFVDWLAEAVAQRATSWRQLAAEAGVSHAALSALRTGKAARPSMETCYRLATFLRADLWRVLRLAGYEVAEERAVDVGDPELDLMFRGLLELAPEEREPVKEFVRFALARAAARRRRRRAEA